jgi:hypothetical protein
MRKRIRCFPRSSLKRTPAAIHPIPSSHHSNRYFVYFVECRISFVAAGSCLPAPLQTPIQRVYFPRFAVRTVPVTKYTFQSLSKAGSRRYSFEVAMATECDVPEIIVDPYFILVAAPAVAGVVSKPYLLAICLHNFGTPPNSCPWHSVLPIRCSEDE